MTAERPAAALAESIGASAAVLDNPSWHALAGAQREFGIVGERAARYRPEVSPIAAVADDSPAALRELAGMVPAGAFVLVFKPAEIAGELRALWRLATIAHLSQWICPQPIEAGPPANFAELGAADVDEMVELAKATDPGPFEQETYRLGDYIGIREQGRLVAMAGERICIGPGGNACREVSAVCTDAAHQGRGYAQALVAEIVRRQQAAGALPFLHVRTGSPAEAQATRVYAKLGFVKRADVPLFVLVRQ